MEVSTDQWSVSIHMACLKGSVHRPAVSVDTHGLFEQKCQYTVPVRREVSADQRSVLMHMACLKGSVHRLAVSVDTHGLFEGKCPQTSGQCRYTWPV